MPEEAYTSVGYEKAGGGPSGSTGMSGAESEGLAAVRERMRAEGVRFVQVETPDLDGGLRGKFLSLDKGLTDGVGWSNIIYGLTTADDVYVSPFSSYENGFADVFGNPDPDTVCRLPWRPDTVAAILDIHDPDGALTPECPRTMLRVRRRQGRRHGVRAALRGRVRGLPLLRG